MMWAVLPLTRCVKKVVDININLAEDIGGTIMPFGKKKWRLKETKTRIRLSSHSSKNQMIVSLR